MERLNYEELLPWTEAGILAVKDQIEIEAREDDGLRDETAL